jgi:hypothetical protein
VRFAWERKNMSIMSGRKMWVLVGILVIIGGAAFVYFDPLDLDLLGWEKDSVVVQPVAPPPASASAAKPGVAAPAAKPGVAAPAAQPPVAAPKAAVAPVQVIAPVSAPSAAPSRTAAPVAPPPKATPVVAAPAATPSVAPPAQALQPPLKLSKSIKTAKTKPERSKSADLRDCLKLETDAAIAKCAGE